MYCIIDHYLSFNRIQKAQEIYDNHVKLVAEKKRQMEEK